MLEKSPRYKGVTEYIPRNAITSTAVCLTLLWSVRGMSGYSRRYLIFLKPLYGKTMHYSIMLLLLVGIDAKCWH